MTPPPLYHLDWSDPVPEFPAPPPRHTPGHLPPCPGCLAKQKTVMDEASFGRLLFKHAAPLWVKEHKCAPYTRKQYEYYIRSLIAFFGEIHLNEIHAGNVEAYKEERLVGNPDGLSGLPTRKIPSGELVRHEINCLKQIMDRAHLWSDTELARAYIPPEVEESTVGRAPEADEVARILAVASSRKRWQLAYWTTIVMMHGVDAGEMTALRVKDFHVEERFIEIRKGLKTKARSREVALRDESWWAMMEILKRYHRICRELDIQPDPDHYILPGRQRGGLAYDPWRRMSRKGWYKAWAAICERAGVKLRRKDLRHKAYTEMVEGGVDQRLVEKSMGHANERMGKKVYLHARLEPLRAAASHLQIPMPKAPADAEQMKFKFETVEEKV